MRFVDVDLDNLHLVPKTCLSSVYWELDDDDDELDPFFQKEEWFSSTLLEWGRCGTLILDGDEAIGFAQYAPPTLFPRLRHFGAGPVSTDAMYLSSCFVVEGRRGLRLGTELVRAVARDLLLRGYQAVEAIGDRRWDGGWVLPEPFLSTCGFHTIREDPRFPLMRRDLVMREPLLVTSERAAGSLPAFGTV
ncbi:MAG: GNAT family N-acetyltransferase [Actinomycetota bacterium]